MALKQAVKDKLKKLGVDPEKLETAVKADGEQDLEIAEMVVMTNDELTARDNNKIAEGTRAGETIGEKKGKELAVKALKKKLNIDDATILDPEKVAEKAIETLGKGDTVLREQVSLLQKDKDTLTQQLEGEKTKSKQAAFDSQLISFFPANRSADLKDAERLTLLKMDLSFEDENGKTVVKKNGEILREANTQNPLPVNAAIGTYFTERKWVAGVDGGRGGKDNPGGGAGGAGMKKLSQVQEQWLKDNPGGNIISPEFQTFASTTAKTVGADFEWNG